MILIVVLIILALIFSVEIIALFCLPFLVLYKTSRFYYYNFIVLPILLFFIPLGFSIPICLLIMALQLYKLKQKGLIQ